MALDGRALYFSRATIPFDRDASDFAGYRKHLGIYAYRKAALERFAALAPSPLEKLERLEQLRLLENGIGHLCGRCSRRYDWRGYRRGFGEGRAGTARQGHLVPLNKKRIAKRIARKNRSAAKREFAESSSMSAIPQIVMPTSIRRFSTPKPPGRVLRVAILRQPSSMPWPRPASSAGRVAKAGCRCAQMCVSSRRSNEAQAAGFRPCKRCRPTTALAGSGPLDKIRAHIEAHVDRPVRLEQLGRVAGLSPFTVQRLFKREMGVSPLQYQRALRAGSLRSSLRQGNTVTDAIYDAGFGSSSRAYEGAQLGMTPARFAQGGKGERIGWSAARTPFGWMIVGATERGLCWLSLASTSRRGRGQLARRISRSGVAARIRRCPGL